MTRGWQTKRLGDVIQLEYGKPLPDSKRKANGKYPVYGANGEKDRTDEYYHDKKSIIVGRKGSAGEINLTVNKFWPLDVTYFVTFNDNENDLYFLFYLLGSLELPKLAKGVKPGINRNEVYDIQVLVPLLPEQKRIVEILDKAFAAIDKAKANVEKNLQNAKELFESYLQKVFNEKGLDWEEKKLDEVFEIKPPKNEAREKLKESDLVTFLPMEDLEILAHEIKPTKKRQLKEVAGSYTYFAEGDVLLAKITPCFENGKVGIAKNLVNGIGFGSSEHIVFRETGQVIGEYLYFFLSRNSFREEGSKKMTGAVGHKRVSKQFIEEYKISYPKKLSEQQQIALEFKRLDDETKKLGFSYLQKLNALEELKKSILQKAFSGELTTKTLAKLHED
jgi:type I restriction enzyme, S subunit